MKFQALHNSKLRKLTTAASLLAAAIFPALISADTPAETTAGADSVEMMSPAEAAAPFTPLADFSTSAPDVADEAADSTAAQFFISAPTEIFPTIDPMTRMDMIDYFQAGSDRPSKNLVGGECRIIEETPLKIVLTTSPVSEYTLAVLPATGKKQEKILMLVRTLKTPAEDSTVTFYNTGWEELTGLFTVPTLDDWMEPEARKNREDVENAVPFVLAKLSYSPADGKVVFTNNLPDYIPEEALGFASGSIKRELVFRWNGKKFVKETR